MSNDNNTTGPDDHEDFTHEAEQERIGIVAEFWDFLKHNKKWWLLPILIVILGIGLLIVLGGSAAAPFIYPLF